MEFACLPRRRSQAGNGRRWMRQEMTGRWMPLKAKEPRKAEDEARAERARRRRHRQQEEAEQMGDRLWYATGAKAQAIQNACAQRQRARLRPRSADAAKEPVTGSTCARRTAGENICPRISASRAEARESRAWTTHGPQQHSRSSRPQVARLWQSQPHQLGRPQDRR